MKKRFTALALALCLICALAVPLSVPAAAGAKSPVKVQAGYIFSMMLTEDGSLYGAGRNNLGQLGDAPTTSGVNGDCVRTPYLIADGVADMEVSKYTSSQNRGGFHTSGGHTMILMEDGGLYVLGDNSCGQLATGDREPHAGLQYVMHGVKAFDAGATSCAVVTEDNDLYYWGLIMQQNSMNASYLYCSTPTYLISDVADVAVGEGHLVILDTDGSVWTFGNAYGGCLGNGMDSGFSNEITKVMDGAVAIAAGNTHSAAITADGQLYAWGQNTSGQIGLNYKTYENVLYPTYIMDDVKAVDCGDRTTFVVKTDDSLWGMGWNYHGELGIGHEAHDGSPIKTASDVAQVSAGHFFAMILKKDGGMYAAGENYDCQFGNGTFMYQNLSWLPAGLTARPIVTEGEMPFADVLPEDWFYDPVQWAVQQGITNGATPTSFAPNETCTRAQILTFLWRANGSVTSIRLDDHPDVGPSDWFFNAVRWATDSGMLPQSGNVDPNGTCTRAMAVEFMWKAAGSPDMGLSNFSDVPANASYAKAVAWAVSGGITQGTSATTFSPKDACTRGQIVTFLHRAEH